MMEFSRPISAIFDWHLKPFSIDPINMKSSLLRTVITKHTNATLPLYLLFQFRRILCATATLCPSTLVNSGFPCNIYTRNSVKTTWNRCEKKKYYYRFYFCSSHHQFLRSILLFSRLLLNFIEGFVFSAGIKFRKFVKRACVCHI